eukprot:TRINITY_DN6955_c0_g3_i1.p1 TRINITY_DN6955_c0_g3~~TRINITY_DN6955_c0_g3_i1.p1  ORF type:complete len:577 (-),score=59.80 TRINITY_DN6955_c0_g3_i1:276-1949(-)
MADSTVLQITGRSLLVSTILDELTERYGADHLLNFTHALRASEDNGTILCPRNLLERAVPDVDPTDIDQVKVKIGRTEYVPVCKLPGVGGGLVVLRGALMFPSAEEHMLIATGLDQGLRVFVANQPPQQVASQIVLLQVLLGRCTAIAHIRRAIDEALGGQAVAVMPAKDAPETEWNSFWKGSFDAAGGSPYVNAVLSGPNPMQMIYEHYLLVLVELDKGHVELGFKREKDTRVQSESQESKDGSWTPLKALSLSLQLRTSNPTSNNVMQLAANVTGQQLASWLAKCGADIVGLCTRPPPTELQRWVLSNLKANTTNLQTFMDSSPRKFLLVRLDAQRETAKVVAVCRLGHGSHDLFCAGSFYETKGRAEWININKRLSESKAQYRVTNESTEPVVGTLGENGQALSFLDCIQPNAAHAESTGLGSSFAAHIASRVPLVGGCWVAALSEKEVCNDGEAFVLAALEPLLVGMVLRSGEGKTLVSIEATKFVYGTSPRTASLPQERPDYFRSYHVFENGFPLRRHLQVDSETWHVLGDRSDMTFYRRKHIAGLGFVGGS